MSDRTHKDKRRVAIPAFLKNPDAAFIADLDAGHLSYEQMEAYVDSKLPTQQRREVEAHARDCRVCSDQLDALNELAAEMAPSAPGRVSWRSRIAEWWAMPQIRWVAAAACAALAIGLFLPQNERSKPVAPAAFQPSAQSNDPVRRAIDDPNWQPAKNADPAGRDAVAKLRQSHPEDHLLLGVVEANYGLLDEAAQDLAQAPASPVVRRLLAAVENSRRSR